MNLPANFDLDLPIAGTVSRGSARGRARKDVGAVQARLLSADDIQDLAEGRGSAAQPLRQLRDRHHSLARYLALGYKPAQVSAITGYSLSRISVLQGDPAFRELLAFYREHEGADFRDTQERIHQTAIDALDEIQERLEQEPEIIAMKDLLGIAQLGLDRSGYGPTQKNIQANVSLSKEELAELRSAARGEQVRLFSAQDQGAAVRPVGVEAPLPEAEEIEAELPESGGPEV